MRSGYSISWADEANNNLDRIINYLEQNWSNKDIVNFFKKLEKRIEIIKQYPQIFPKSQILKNVHCSVLTKQITIYYSVENEIIRILSLFDTRQDPSKLKI